MSIDEFRPLLFKLGLIGGGLFVDLLMIQQLRLNAVAKLTPQTITCEALAANGPGDNVHIKLTKFLLCDQSFVYETKRDSSHWERVWIPVVPGDGEYVKQIAALRAKNPNLIDLPPPSDIRIILRSPHVHDMDDLNQLLNEKTIKGMVVNKISFLDLEESVLLEKNYPGVDFSKCYILSHDRRPIRNWLLFLGIGVGVVVSLTGVVWLVSGLQWFKKYKDLHDSRAVRDIEFY